MWEEQRGEREKESREKGTNSQLRGYSGNGDDE